MALADPNAYANSVAARQQVGTSLSDWGRIEPAQLTTYPIGNNLAALYRRDYENYRRRFVPIENELLGAYRNTADRREAIQTGLADVNAGFDRAQDAFRDQLRGRGLALTPEQEAFQQKRSDFQRGLAEVTAINRTNRRFDQRDRELLTTGVAPQSALARKTAQ